MRRLETVDEVIDAIGGRKKPADNNKAVAAWLGLNTSAVCNWRERGSIPSGWHLRFYLEAAKRRLEIAPGLFGLENWSGMPSKKKRANGAARQAA